MTVAMKSSAWMLAAMLAGVPVVRAQDYNQNPPPQGYPPPQQQGYGQQAGYPPPQQQGYPQQQQQGYPQQAG